MSQSTIHAISLRHETISLTLVSEVLILSHKDQPSKGKIFRGIWDTGATGSVITQKIVDQLGLKPTGVAVVQTAGVRDFQTTTYLIDVYLKDGLCIQSINASLGSVTDDIDCLIGMDIICLGDFVRKTMY